MTDYQALLIVLLIKKMRGEERVGVVNQNKKMNEMLLKMGVEEPNNLFKPLLVVSYSVSMIPIDEAIAYVEKCIEQSS